MKKMNFDEDDDEFIPFSIRGEMSDDGKKKKKKKFDSWTGEFDEFDEGGLDLGGGSASSSMFVSAGGLEDQLKKEQPVQKKEKLPKPPKPLGSASKKVKKSTSSSKLNVDKEKFGVGAAMLEKLGWTGSGLGKKGTGITQALEVKMRPVGVGLGMVEEKTEAMRKIERQRKGLEDEDDEDDDDNDDEGENEGVKGERAVERTKRWKKSGEVKQKVSYKTAYDLLQEEAPTNEQEQQKLVIFDLTGPTEKVVLDAKKLYDKERSSENYKAGIGKELRYNIDKLVDMSEVDVKTKSRKVNQMQQKANTFGGQVEDLTKSLAEAELHASNLRSIENMVDRLVLVRDEMQSAAADSDDVAENLVAKLSGAFLGVRKKFGESLFSLLSLPDLFYAILEPTLRKYFARSKFGQDEASRGVEMSNKMKSVLGSSEYWGLFLSSCVVAPLRTWLVREWDCKSQAIEAVELVRSWQDVLGEENLHFVVHEVVWQKLQSAADAWDPYTDQTALHFWIHPWLMHLSERMERDLFPSIVQKLNTALADWDPRDASAHALLSPWKNVFTASQLELLSTSRIVPKLTSLLSAIKLAPTPQPATDELLELVLVWHDWVPMNAFVKLLARSFFPSWYRGVYELALSAPDGGLCPQAVDWYQTVRAAFPAPLFANHKIVVLFAHYLDVALNVVAGRTDFEPEFVPVDLWNDTAPSLPSSSSATRKSSSTSLSANTSSDLLSFRAMVETFAGQNNILFLPITSRTFNGKPLYSFGGIPVYFGNQLLYAEEEAGKWRAASLEYLADRCRVRASHSANVD